jgi:hypothetical protein
MSPHDEWHNPNQVGLNSFAIDYIDDILNGRLL